MFLLYNYHSFLKMATRGVFDLIYNDAKRTKCKCGRVYIPCNCGRISLQCNLENVCPEYCLHMYLKQIYDMLEKKTIKPIVDIIMGYLPQVRPNDSLSFGSGYLISTTPNLKI